MGAGTAAPGSAPDDFDADEQFASFADSLCARAAAEPGSRRLVVLGDLLDVLRLARTDGRATTTRPLPAALGRIERIAAAHPEVFAALGRLAAAGYDLDVVPGNHDMDLARPAAGERLRDAVCGSDARLRARLRVHPWVLHAPGLLYAEHGSQHHDINRFPALLEPWGSDPAGPLDEPLGAHLGERPAGGALAAARRAADVTRGLAADTLLRARRGNARAARAYRARAVAPYAALVGLPPGALAAVDRASATSTPRMLARVARAMATGRGGYDLREPARETHRLLAAHHAAVPCYVFAHSHAADRVELSAGSSPAIYLNTGTWSIPRPKPGLPHSGERLTYVSVTRPAPAAPPRARLMRWDAGARRHVTLA